MLQVKDGKNIDYRSDYYALGVILFELISKNNPSLTQSIKMKKFIQDGKLTNEVIQSIMDAKNKLGISEDTASFVLPFGATANMDGTGIFFGFIVDQIHTATNATSDLVVATCVSATEGTLDRNAPAYVDTHDFS